MKKLTTILATLIIIILVGCKKENPKPITRCYKIEIRWENGTPLNNSGIKYLDTCGLTFDQATLYCNQQSGPSTGKYWYNVVTTMNYKIIEEY
jgi:hypothetical protein